MKNFTIKIILLSVIVFSIDLNSFILRSKWLDIEDTYNPYSIYYDDWMSDAMSDSLSVYDRILFNIDNCLTNMNSDSITNLPEISNGGLNSIGNPLLRYSRYCVVNEAIYRLWADEYGITVSPIVTGKYHTFTITINDSTRFPWNKNGGGHYEVIEGDTVKIGGVDINTILRHETGHGFGLDHELGTALQTLMSRGSVYGNNNNPVQLLGQQEIWGLEALYDAPRISIESANNSFIIGDSIKIRIRGPIDYRLYSSAGFHGYLSLNSENYESTPYFINCSSDFYVDTLFTYVPDSVGTYKFKAYTAMEWNSSASLSLYEQHNRPFSEISFDVARRQCRVDLPLPATESWFDFETRLNFAGSILAEPTFADSLDNVLLYMDVYDDYNSALYEMPISIFASYYDTYFSCDSTAYFCEFTKDSKSKQRKINPVSFDVLEKAMKDKIKEFFVPLIKPSVEKGTKSIVEYPAFTARFPHSLDLYPGTYTVYFQAIRKDLYEANGTISEIAKADSMQFIIPQWKMKLRKDEWYQDKVPYTEIKEYEKTKIMQVILWRPWFWGPYEPLNLNIVRETDSVTVQNFVVDFNTKAAYDLLEWEIPEATVPGFYDVKADNLDYHFNINVNQEIITQVCPIYLSWENGGSWPDNWPGSNNADWEMHLSSSWTPALGAYALGAVYFPEGNTGKVELEKTGIAIESEWDRVLEFAIGLQKTIGTNDFDVLMAHFSVATSTDGANWTIEKTADLSEYTPVAWNPDKQHCFIKTFKPLGKVTNLGIKFIKEGFTSSELDSNIVLFDEVKVDFTKTPLKTGPTDPSAQYAGGNVNVGWSGAAKVDKALDNYYVYRNGIKIGETTTVTFVDSTVSANTFYNYAITAHYDDGSLLPESPMNECSISIYTGLYSPSNLVITNENPNIKLTWSPVSGASEYKVYSSNDPYGTFAEDTSGTFNGEEWIAPLSSSRLFYYVVAVNESMKEKRILKESSNRVK